MRRYAPTLLALGILLHYLGSLHELEEALVTHVLGQHILFLAGGYLTALGFEHTLLYTYIATAKGGPGLAAVGLLKRLARIHHRLNPQGVTSTGLFSGLVVAWHIPQVFNQFVVSEDLHTLMHVSFSFMGVLAYLSGKMLYAKMKIILLLAAGKLMIIYGFFLTLSSQHLYIPYPFHEQPQLGVSMILSMLFIELGLVPYIIYRKYFVGV